MAAAVSMGLAVGPASALAAEPEFVGVLALAVEPEVAQELQLSEEQVRGLQKVIDQRESEVAEIALQVKDLPYDERQEKLGPFREESEKQGLALLNEKQREGLEGIRARVSGLVVLAEPALAERFGLSDDQRLKLGAVLVERTEKLATADTDESRRQILMETERSLGLILSPDQSEKWTQLIAVSSENSTETLNELAPSAGNSSIASGTVGQADQGTAGSAQESSSAPQPPAESQIRFSFSFQPWKDVITWFAEQAELSLIMDDPPPGTFNYSDPYRSYTPDEALDVLNGVLLTKGFTLVRNERNLFVINREANEIPDALIREVPLKSLAGMGEFSVVRVRFMLKKITAEEAQTEVEGMLGPDGKVVPLPKAGQILVTDTVGRLRAIHEVIESIEQPVGQAAGQELKVFQLRYALLADVIDTVKILLGIEPDKSATEDGSVRLAEDPMRNRVLVQGKPDQLASVQEIIKALDEDPGQASPSDLVSAQTTLQFEVYQIHAADPASVLAVMQTLMAGPEHGGTRLSIDEKTGSLYALATPQDHSTIQATLQQLEGGGQQIEVFPLRRLDPVEAVLTLNKLFTEAEGSTSKPPTVTSDSVNRRLIVKGTTAQIEQVRQVLAKIGESTLGPADAPGFDSVVESGGTLRVVPLSGRTARAALEQAQLLFQSTRTNRIRVVTPSAIIPELRPSDPIVPPSEETEPPPAGGEGEGRPLPVEPLDRPVPMRGVGPPPGAVRTTFVSGSGEGVPERLTDVTGGETGDGQPSEPPLAGGEAAPIVVTIGPSGILLASPDVAALDEFENLLLAIAASRGTGPELTVYYLKSATAQTVAETLDLIFSGGSISSAGGGSSLLGSLGSAAFGDLGGALGNLLGSSDSGGVRSTPVGAPRIVPDSRLNALIVEAKPEDLDMIEQLLVILDKEDLPETNVSPRPRLIPVRFTSADSIAQTIREVYQNRLIGGGRSGGGQPSPEEFLQALRGGGGRNNSRSRQSQETRDLAVSVDGRTNSLVIAAPEQLFVEIDAFVATLDTVTADSAQAMEVVRLGNSNGDAISRALSAIGGSNVRTSTSGSSSTSNRSQGGDNSSPFGGLDFNALQQRANFFNQLRGGGGGGFSGGGGFPGGGGGFPGGGGFGRGQGGNVEAIIPFGGGGRGFRGGGDRGRD
jgi:type II secretory pathway component GspD/PulD (secretin)